MRRANLQAGSAEELWRKPKPVVPLVTAGGVSNTRPLPPLKALARLSAFGGAGIVLPTTGGREVRLRRITEPTPGRRELLR